MALLIWCSCPASSRIIELAWEEPYLARFLRRLAAFTRVIFFDKRGTGLSDPVSRPPWPG
jgi:hypothetical protein